MSRNESVSFVWPDHLPFTPWAGGSETYTVRQAAELRKQGIDAQLVLHPHSLTPDLEELDIPIKAVQDKAGLAKLDTTLIFVLEPSFDCNANDFSRPSYVALHTPKNGVNDDLRGHSPLVPSQFMAEYWKRELNLPQLPPVIYPPISEDFSRVARQGTTGKALYAGRPTVKKGVYTLLASMHCPPLSNRTDYLSCVETINNNDPGTDIMHALYNSHPGIRVVPAQSTTQAMAAMLAAYDVLIVPSVWQEPFCMLSVEAQHAGCRVVASNIGGLPETDCGGLILVEPNNPFALAEGIAKGLAAGPLTPEERANTTMSFTPEDSVRALRRAIHMA